MMISANVSVAVDGVTCWHKHWWQSSHQLLAAASVSSCHSATTAAAVPASSFTHQSLTATPSFTSTACSHLMHPTCSINDH